MAKLRRGVGRSEPKRGSRLVASTRKLARTAGGALSNLGYVMRDTNRYRVMPGRWSRSARGPVPRIRRQGRRRKVGWERARHADRYRPHRQTWDGPAVIQSHKDARPPVCVYCGGKCERVLEARSSDNTERGEQHWRCRANFGCVSGGRVVVIRRYALGQYNGRS